MHSMKRGPDCSKGRFWGTSAAIAALTVSLIASTSQMAQAVSPTDAGLGLTNAQGANIHLLADSVYKVGSDCVADSTYQLLGSADKVNPVLDAIKNRQDAPKNLSYTIKSKTIGNSENVIIDLAMPATGKQPRNSAATPPADLCSDAGLAKYGLKYANVRNSLEPDWWKGFVAAFAAFATYATITFAISGLMVLAAGPAIEFWAARIGGCVGGGASNLVANLIMGIKFNGKLMTSTIGNCIFGGIGPKVFGQYLPKFITWVDTSFTGWVLRAAGKWLRQWLTGIVRTGATQVRTVIEMVGQEFSGVHVALNAAMALPSAPVQPVTPADELVGAASNRCVSNPTTSATNGVQLQILDCVNGTNQQITSDGSALQLLGKCLDVGQQAATPGTPVQLWTCWGGASQQWTVNSNGTIVSVPSGLCLGVAGGATANASNLDMETCNGGSSQNWSTGSATASANQQFKHVGSGLCLSNPTKTATLGVQLQILDCANGTNQQISTDDGSNLEVLGRCIDVQGQHTTPGTVVQLYTCNGGSNQQWTVNPDDTIVGVGSGLCLAVAGSATTSGSGLDIETCDGSANQVWVNAPSTPPVQQYSDAGSGRCVSNPTTTGTNGVQLQILDCANTTNQQISSVGSTLQVLGKCFDVQGRHTTPGTVVDLYTCNGGTNQQWTFNDDGTIVGVGSGLCLAVAGSATASGSGLDIETCNGASSQNLGQPVQPRSAAGRPRIRFVRDRPGAKRHHRDAAADPRLHRRHQPAAHRHRWHAADAGHLPQRASDRRGHSCQPQHLQRCGEPAVDAQRRRHDRRRHDRAVPRGRRGRDRRRVRARHRGLQRRQQPGLAQPGPRPLGTDRHPVLRRRIGLVPEQPDHDRHQRGPAADAGLRQRHQPGDQLHRRHAAGPGQLPRRAVDRLRYPRHPQHLQRRRRAAVDGQRRRHHRRRPVRAVPRCRRQPDRQRLAGRHRDLQRRQQPAVVGSVTYAPSADAG